MVAVKYFFTLIALSLKMGVDGLDKPACPTAAIVNLTENIADSSGSVNKSSDIFPPEAVWIENNLTCGCPGNIKQCLQFCCPLGYAINDDQECLGDDFTSDILRGIQERIDQTEYNFTYLPHCRFNSTDGYSTYNDYEIQQDGSIYAKDTVEEIGIGKYCFFRETDSMIYKIARCGDDFEIDQELVSAIVGSNVCMIFLLATFVVYSVLPELKNLQGSIFRCYLASYISSTTLFTIRTLVKEIDAANLYLEVFSLIGAGYFAIACMLWLNVMSFDAWRTFRSFQPCQTNLKQGQKKTFIRYSVYGWGCSAAVLCTLFMLSYLTYIPTHSSTDGILIYAVLLPASGIAICNTCFYISTAMKIKARKKETSHLIDGVNKHHRENEQWFNLYVKLFLIMGGYMIIRVILMWLDLFILSITILEDTIRAFHGILIFLVFVWKDDVKQSIRKRFTEILDTSICRRNARPVTENINI